MPEQKGNPQEKAKGNPPVGDFVARVVKDPAQPPDVLLLVGYLGASSEAGYTRLYFDAQLSNYVEIPDAAILHTQQIPVEQSALGESYVWIDKNAEIIHGKVGPNRPKAKFLEGPIFQDFMAGAQAGGAQVGGGAAQQALPRPTQLGSQTCAPALCVRPSIAQPCWSQVPVACPPPQATLLGNPTCAPELCLLPSVAQQCPPPQATQLGSPTCAPELCLRPSIVQFCPTPSAVQLCRSQAPALCPPPQVTQLGSPTCAPELCLRPSIVQFCPTPSAVQLCHTQALAVCAPSVAQPCLSQTPVACTPPSVALAQCPPITLPFCPTEACPPPTIAQCPAITLPFCPTEACPQTQACQPPIAQGGGGAMAQQVQPFAAAAPQPALPQTQLFCPTHAPFFCPQTVPPACPQLTPPQTQLFCPTHPPFFCPQTVPPVCPQLTPPQTQLFCPTHPPFFCPQTIPPACPLVTFAAECLTIAGCPWPPVSIACGWGQQPGGTGEVLPPGNIQQKAEQPGESGQAGGAQQQKPEQSGGSGQTGGTGQG